MDKPKVLQVVRPTKGGIGKHIVTLVEGIRDFFDVTVACPVDDFPGLELRAAGVKILPLSLAGDIAPRSDYRSFKKLARFMTEQGTELVHSHGAKAALVARPAALRAKVPVSIYTVHNTINHDNHPAWKNKAAALIEHVLSRSTDCIITVSCALRDEIAQREKIKGDKIRVIRNGINFNRLKPPAEPGRYREKWGIPPHCPVVGTVARMAPQKGLEQLIRAADIVVHNHNHNVHFLIAGDGPLRAALQNQVAIAGLEGRFTFTGMVTDIATVYSLLDIFVLSSLTEGLPLSLLEAMSFSLPAVVTAVGGIPEVVRHGQNGLLVPPGRPDKLARAIIHLLGEPYTARQMGTKARHDVLAAFGAGNMITSTSKLYRELLVEKGLSTAGDELLLAP